MKLGGQGCGEDLGEVGKEYDKNIYKNLKIN